MSNCVLPLISLGKCFFLLFALVCSKDVYYFKHVKNRALSMDTYIFTCSYASFFGGRIKSGSPFCLPLHCVSQYGYMYSAPQNLWFKLCLPWKYSQVKVWYRHVGSCATTLQHTQSCLKQQCSVCTHGDVFYESLVTVCVLLIRMLMSLLSLFTIVMFLSTEFHSHCESYECHNKYRRRRRRRRRSSSRSDWDCAYLVVSLFYCKLPCIHTW